jgi:hypothetical protein
MQRGEALFPCGRGVLHPWMRAALTALVAASTTAPGRKRQIQPPRRLIRCVSFVVCDHASPSAAVVLHLRPRYVSKAAILGLPGHIVPVKKSKSHLNSKGLDR